MWSCCLGSTEPSEPPAVPPDCHSHGSCRSPGRVLTGCGAELHVPRLCPGCLHRLGRCRAARGALSTRNSSEKSPELPGKAAECFLPVSPCTVIQAGSGVSWLCEDPAVTHPQWGQRGEGCWVLHKQPQGSSVTVLGVLCHEVLLASGNRCFSQVLRGSGWICVSSVRVKEACPCVLGCCCSCGVHSCFLSFLDNPDRHSMLHF